MINNGEENGGNQGVPAVAPTVSILPKFNSMAVFTVQPGRSYHSVQVV
jgi:prolyl 3-hydroxylase /prolyl 3,4-dihydroxylase